MERRSSIAPLAENTGKNILIVEDNPINQKILANFLGQGGHLCQVVHNGLEAVELFKKFNFDAIFMVRDYS